MTSSVCDKVNTLTAAAAAAAAGSLADQCRLVYRLINGDIDQPFSIVEVSGPGCLQTAQTRHRGCRCYISKCQRETV